MTTATISYPALTWVNKDGLIVRFGKGNQVDAIVGKPTQYGVEQTVEALITADRLPTFNATGTVGSYVGGYPNVSVPAGAMIKSAVLQVNVAEASAASQTLDIGLVTSPAADGTVTEVDCNGLFAALAQSAVDTVGESNTGAGALIGTILATESYLFAHVGTANFTTLEARLTVTYYMPESNNNNT